MSKLDVIPERGYLIHISHYDPVWIERKATEEPFNLKIGNELVSAAARAGLNRLVIDLEDAVILRSHPELKKHYSVPMAALLELAAGARQQGMEIIPKLNFSKGDINGHNDWFQPYTKLEDTDEYWTKAFEVIDEVIEACKPERFFFIGMDEDTHRTAPQYVAAVQRLRADLKQRGLRAVMWNDSLHLGAGMFECVRNTLAAEAAIEKDVIQVIWDYGPVRRYALERIQDLVKKGFEVWIAPGGDAGHVRAWHQAALDLGCQGMVLTMWRPGNSANREDMLSKLNTLGPLYGVKREPGQPPVKGIEATHIAAAPPPEQTPVAPVTGEILAPNFLKKALPATPYLLPPEVYLKNWMVLGPFAFKATDYEGKHLQGSIEAAAFPREQEAALTAKPEGTLEAGVAWRKWQPQAGNAFPHIVNLARMYNGLEYAWAYLVAHIHSAKEAHDYRLYLGSDDYVRVWLNGQLLYTYNTERRGILQDHDLIQGITLRKGWNILVVKCVNIVGGWGLMARIANAKNKPLVTNVK